ncbi:21744_t:CDS:2 [Entrophospora sp. SA101]|nr:21744_t:CDS:2 [Entrophospora sp. SA101]
MESNILSPFNSINNDDTVESESIDITFNKDYIRYIEKQLDKEPITEWYVGSINVMEKFNHY